MFSCQSNFPSVLKCEYLLVFLVMYDSKIKTFVLRTRENNQQIPTFNVIFLSAAAWFGLKTNGVNQNVKASVMQPCLHYRCGPICKLFRFPWTITSGPAVCSVMRVHQLKWQSFQKHTVSFCRYWTSSLRLCASLCDFLLHFRVRVGYGNIWSVHSSQAPGGRWGLLSLPLTYLQAYAKGGGERLRTHSGVFVYTHTHTHIHGFTW